MSPIINRATGSCQNIGIVELTPIFHQLGIAAGLGLLVGLQRERTESELAGMRTFPLITVFGTLAALLAQSFGGWVLAAAFVALAAMIVMANQIAMRSGHGDPGMTSEMAMLVMFSVGASVVVLPLPFVLVIGGGVAVILQFKTRLHGLASKLGDEDLTAIMRFALIALVILPILPNHPFGPFDVLNLFEIWLMVVLIVGISLTAYILYKFVGEKVGTLLGGVLGGLISSTATTVSWAQRTRRKAVDPRSAAGVIMIASMILVIRVLVEIRLVGPSLFATALPPIAALLGVFIVLCLVTWKDASRADGEALPEREPPSELGPALFFGALYAIVLVAVAAAKDWFGTRGMLAVAAISGLTDVDAITLSTAQLVEAGRIAPALGWKVIVVGTLSNTVFKGATVAVLGSRSLLKVVGTLYGIAFVAGALILAFWPA